MTDTYPVPTRQARLMVSFSAENRITNEKCRSTPNDTYYCTSKPCHQSTLGHMKETDGSRCWRCTTHRCQQNPHENATHPRSPSFRGVPVVLYGVICSSRKHFGDFRPLVTMHTMRPHENVFLRSRPGVLLYGRVQLVVPPDHACEREHVILGIVMCRKHYCTILIVCVMIITFTLGTQCAWGYFECTPYRLDCPTHGRRREIVSKHVTALLHASVWYFVRTLQSIII